MKRFFATAASVLCAALALTSCMFIPSHSGGFSLGGESDNYFGGITGTAEDGTVSVWGSASIESDATVLYLDLAEDREAAVTFTLSDVHRTVTLSYRDADGNRTRLFETNADSSADRTPLSLKAGLGEIQLSGAGAKCSFDISVEGLDPEKVNYAGFSPPDDPVSESLFGAGEASSRADAASGSAEDGDYIAEANRIAMEFVDGPTGRYLKGELSGEEFKTEAAAARDAILDNARDALTARGFSGAELEELMAAETRMVGDVYLCVEDVMKPARELAALEGTTYGSDNPFGAFKDVMGPIGELTTAGKKWAGALRADQESLQALEEKYAGRLPAGYLVALTSKTQADQYADDLDMGDFSSLFPQD